MNSEMTNRKEQKVDIPGLLATGQITIAQAVGLSRENLYEIAKRGYQLMNSGKLEEAKQIYAGLVAADPYDSVFHCHLGAVLQRLGETERALEEFDAALRYNIANVDALAARGEIYLQKGDLTNAVTDLRRAVELDPNGARPQSKRARALLLSLHQAARQAAAGQN